MAVAQLYHHLAPREDVAVVTRALIRLLRSHREVQTVVLNSVASMSVNRKVHVNVIAILKKCLILCFLLVKGHV
jgi:hypothetical protein